jgi:IclR family transcriptional regulator, KDG regulon repressor
LPNDRSTTLKAPALDRGLAVLEVLDTKPDGLTLTEISNAIESPKNSTSRLIETLIARDYIARDNGRLRFRLTSKLLRMGQPRVCDASLVECSLEAMRALRDRVGETVQLGVGSEDNGVIIEQIESNRSVRIVVELGTRFQLYNNAPGKVLLAFQSPTAQASTINRLKLVRSTERTITTKAALRQECEEIVQVGYGTDWGEADEGIHCVAAPIRDRHRNVDASIWVSAIAGRMPKRQFAAVGEQVIRAASEIERRRGTCE